jgi:hypothetical protein
VIECIAIAKAIGRDPVRLLRRFLTQDGASLPGSRSRRR